MLERRPLLLGLLAAHTEAWLGPRTNRARAPRPSRLQAVVPELDVETDGAFAYAAEIREHAPSLFERLRDTSPEETLEMLAYAEQL